MKDVFSPEYCPSELLGVKDYTKSWRDYDGLYDLAASFCSGSLWAEFGVGMGNSARRWLQRLDRRGKLFLFDSWLGIPTDWNLGVGRTDKKRRYRSNKPNLRDPRAVFYDGRFCDTLPVDFPDRLSLVHFDCDVYESTRDALSGLGSHIGPGTVLVFDELIGYQNYAQHEYRALSEWLDGNGYGMRWLGKERFAVAGVVE